MAENGCGGLPSRRGLTRATHHEDGVAFAAHVVGDADAVDRRSHGGNLSGGKPALSFAPAGSLADRLKQGDKEVEIFGQRIEVRAKVVSMDGMSAHADRDELLRFLSYQDKQFIKKIIFIFFNYSLRFIFFYQIFYIFHFI